MPRLCLFHGRNSSRSAHSATKNAGGAGRGDTRVSGNAASEGSRLQSWSHYHWKVTVPHRETDTISSSRQARLSGLR
jgi:hypothetical protein